MTELFKNAPNFPHLLRVRSSELTAADEKRVFQPNSYVAAHRRRLRCEGHLETAGRQDGPPVVVSKQPVGGLFHEHEVLGLGADAAQDAEYRLHEEWRLNEFFVDEMSQIVEVSDIVAFVLEARTMLFAEGFEDALDIAERIAEDEIVAPVQVWLLPVILPGGVAIRERENAEVHRSHVERTHLWLGEQRCGEPLLEAHMNASAGRDVYDRIGRLFDARQESHVNGGIRGRTTVLRIAGVQMQNGRACLRGLDGLRGNFIGRDRQDVRHRRRMNAARDRAGDDYLSGFRSRHRSQSQ